MVHNDTSYFADAVRTLVVPVSTLSKNLYLRSHLDDFMKVLRTHTGVRCELQEKSVAAITTSDVLLVPFYGATQQSYSFEKTKKDADIKGKCVLNDAIKVKVHVYSLEIPVGLAELTLTQSHLPRENAAQFSAAVAVFTVPILVPCGTHYCWVDRGGVDLKLAQGL